MKKSIIFCVLIVIAISAFSDEVTLKDGRVFECEIIGKKGFDIFINSNGEFYKVDRGSIEDIIFEGKFMTDLIYLKNDFMKSYPKKLIILEADKNTMIKNGKLKTIKQKNYEYKNFYLFPVSVLAFALAWDSFAEASDISDIIKNTPDGISTSGLESQRTRKSSVGWAASFAFIINTFYCFDKVEVSAKKEFLTVNYKF